MHHSRMHLRPVVRLHRPGQLSLTARSGWISREDPLCDRMYVHDLLTYGVPRNPVSQATRR